MSAYADKREAAYVASMVPCAVCGHTRLVHDSGEQGHCDERDDMDLRCPCAAFVEPAPETLR